MLLLLGFHMVFQKAFGDSCLSPDSFNYPAFLSTLSNTTFHFYILGRPSPPSWSLNRYLTSVAILIVAHILKV